MSTKKKSKRNKEYAINFAWICVEFSDVGMYIDGNAISGPDISRFLRHTTHKYMREK